jgi:hypothetical protein
LFHKTKKVQPLFIILVSFAGLAGNYLASGTQNRAVAYSRDSIRFYVSLFLGNIWQFIWMLSIIALIALISHLFLVPRLTAPLRFPDGVRLNLRLLGIASLLSQLFIETFVYPAAYHWFSLLLVCSIWFFVEIGSVEIKFLDNNKKKNLVTFLYGMVLILLLITLIHTINTASERKMNWSERSSSSLIAGVRDMKDIPALDNLGERLAQDLEITFPSIVPFSGLMENFTMYCYRKLPIGF